MDYREHAVPLRLRQVVETIWTLEAGADPAAPGQPVFPDGRAELIVHFGDAFERIDDGVASRQAPLLFAGQIDKPLVLRATGRAAVLGIRLRPAGASALMRVPQHELAGRTDDLRDICRPLAACLGEVRERAASLDEAVALSGRAIAGIADVNRINRRVSHATAVIDNDPSTATVASIARSVGLTPRQLERLFSEHVGLTPKRFMRVRRLQRALHLLEVAGGTQSTASIAIAAGYADQAHLVRECRALTGSTPAEQERERSALTELFIDRGGHIDSARALED